VIEGFLLLVDDLQTTGGRLEVFVSDTPNLDTGPSVNSELKCSLQNGVGDNAQGGVFNCGEKKGRYVKIVCQETCTPYLTLSMVRIWRFQAMSALVGTRPYVPTALNKLAISGGSGITDNYNNLTGASSYHTTPLSLRDSLDVINTVEFGIELLKPGFVEEIFIQTFSETEMFAYVTDADPNGNFAANYVNRCGDNTLGTIYRSAVKPCAKRGRYVTVGRLAPQNTMALEKVVVVGQFCDRKNIEVLSNNYNVCYELTGAGY